MLCRITQLPIHAKHQLNFSVELISRSGRARKDENRASILIRSADRRLLNPFWFWLKLPPLIHCSLTHMQNMAIDIAFRINIRVVQP